LRKPLINAHFPGKTLTVGLGDAFSTGKFKGYAVWARCQPEVEYGI
jgi:hypothetical protein